MPARGSSVIVFETKAEKGKRSSRTSPKARRAAIASKVPLPEDHGQHWAVWLLEWARYNRDVFLARSGLLEQYMDGAVSADSIAPTVDRILGVLVGQGFSVADANVAYELVSTCSLGAAVERRSTFKKRAVRSAASSEEFWSFAKGRPDSAAGGNEPTKAGLARASTSDPATDFRATVGCLIKTSLAHWYAKGDLFKGTSAAHKTFVFVSATVSFEERSVASCS